jgi:glutaredoxin
LNGAPHCMLLALAFALCATLVVASDARAQVLYKSIGPDGKVTYADRPPADGTVTKTMRVEELPNTALPAKTVAELQQLQKSAAKSVAAPPAGVVLFAASWCGYCRMARSYLGQRGIPFQEVDIDTASGKMAFVQAGGVGGVPLLLANGRKLRGFSAQAYDALFAAVR